jgi:hypothetical protein
MSQVGPLVLVGTFASCAPAPPPPPEPLSVVVPTGPPCFGSGTVTDLEGAHAGGYDRWVDEELRPTEELVDDAGFTLVRRRTWTWADDLLIESVTEDPVLGAELVETFAYDDAGRQVLRRAEYEPDVPWAWVEEVWVYDALGQRVEVRTETSDGVVTEVRFTWVDGRVERAETFQDGVLAGVTTWTYVAPPPSLDHLQEADTGADGTIEVTIDRTHDDAGRVVEELESYAGGESARRAYTWDDADRPTADLYQDDTRAWLYQWSYDELGLPASESTDFDDDNDGLVDRGTRTDWWWRCEG